ncbi:MAG: hypothetical protein DYG92_10730 [Leptolyngbya sp. PLA1]|nr:hypothetical protein [Leptolyngbya sp. PLA1]
MIVNALRVVCASVLAVGLGGCSGGGSAGPAPTGRAPGLDLVVPRLDLVPGRTAVVPLGSVQPDDGLRCVLEDGRAIAARVVVIARAMPLAEDRAGWLPEPGEWTSGAAVSQVRGAAEWAAVIEMPADAGGAWLDLGGRRVAVRWIGDGSELPREPYSEDDTPWRPARDPAIPPSVVLSPRFIGEQEDPRTRWRWHLIADGLCPEDDPGRVPSARFESDDVEAFARQHESRWRAAMVRVWGIDADLAWRLKRRIAAIVEFGEAQFAPAWPLDLADLDALVARLLDPAARDATVAAVAEAWLAAQPPAFAWIEDDGAILDAARTRVLATAAVASVFDRPTLAWAGVEGQTPELRELPSYRTLRLLVPPRVDPAVLFAPVEVHAGRWQGTLTAMSRPLPVEPPGTHLRPFAADLTLEAWQRGEALEAAWPAACLLHKPAMPPGSEQPASRSRSWELYGECRVLGRGAQGLAEEVRVYFGPVERPVAVVRISELGESAFLPVTAGEEGVPELLPPATGAQVQRTADRWTFRLPLPPGAVEKDGIVRVGVVRIDALGRRSSWPRAMLPWQDAPARGALDTRAWAAPGEQSP